MEARTFVMGDIHGNLRAFDQCIGRSDIRPEVDQLIQLGDVSDRHPDTALVVERLLEFANLIAIRGNHDEWTLQWLKDGTQDRTWLLNGGGATIESYQQASIDQDKHYRFFSETQQDWYVDPKNRLFVHAGYSHPQGPGFDEDPATCRWDRSLWQTAIEAHRLGVTPELLSSFNEIYIGHTPTINWHDTQPMQRVNVWNLDTGAGTSGRLTIMDVATKEYWQSDPADALY